MTMQLVCDHCRNVIDDAEYREVRSAIMVGSPVELMGGTARTQEETAHYHTVCYQNRMALAAEAPLSASSSPTELPADHPLSVAARRVRVDRDDQIRTAIDVGAQERRTQLERLGEETLRELALKKGVDDADILDEESLVDALMKIET